MFYLKEERKEGNVFFKGRKEGRKCFSLYYIMMIGFMRNHME